MAPLVETLAREGTQAFALTPEVAAAAAELAELARQRGLVGLADIADKIAAALNREALDGELFALYRHLTLFENDSELSWGSSPPLAEAARLLGRWCVAQGGRTLGRLALATNGGPERPRDWGEIGEQVGRFWCIAHALQLPTASQVASALHDLAVRIHTGEHAPEPAMTRALILFVEAARPLASGLEDGDLDPLFLETSAEMSNLGIAKQVKSVVAGLQLPEAFHETLSPESLQSAFEAIERGHKFYIIRADTERRPEIAEPFFAWVTSAATVIGSATVFDGNATLFDFLIASALDGAAVHAALKAIDADETAVKIVKSVEPPPPDGGARAASAAAEPQPTDAANVMERLGEVVTAHAASRQVLQRFIDSDVMAAIQRRLSPGGGAHTLGFAGVSTEAFAAWSNDLEHLMQLENQIDASLEHLQQAVLAARSRSAGPALARLCESAQAAAARMGLSLSLSSRGGEESVDSEILGALEEAGFDLIPVVLERLTGERASGAELSLAVQEAENRISLIVEFKPTSEDSQVSSAASEAIERIGASLRGRGGDLKPTTGSNGVSRFVASLPQSMSLLDGMVMRIGLIKYVVPIRSVQRILHCIGNDVIQISAGDGAAMLRVDAQTFAPIARLAHDIPRERGEAKPQALAAGQLFVLIVDRGRVGALSIDEILGQQPLLVRPLSGCLSSIRGSIGCAVLGDGAVGVVLDPATLVTAEAEAA